MKEKLLKEIMLVKEYHLKQDVMYHKQFESLKESGDKFEIERIIAEDIRSQKIYSEAIQDLKRVNTLDLSREQLKDLKKKYDDYKYEIDNQKSTSLNVDPIIEEHPEEKPTYEGPEVKEQKSNAGKYVAIGVAGALLGVAGTYALTNSNNKEDGKVVTTDETQNDGEKVEITEDQNTVQGNINNLKLGEYGTFFDITDDAQVEARANYIYETYYQPLMNDLSENEKSVITVDNIANCIRVMNGELPLDENGNKMFDVNIVDDYGQKFFDIYSNVPSSPQLHGWHTVPAHLFTTDGTELQEFIKSYDEIYKRIAEIMSLSEEEKEELKKNNISPSDLMREQVEKLGYKFWNEWQCQGMYGDVNPYNFQAKDRLFAFLSTMSPYGTTVFEYNLDSMQPVCVKVCVDYNTKLLTDITVSEIYTGIVTGEWNNVIAKAAGVEVDNVSDSVGFSQDLFDTLEYKYDHLQTRKLS